MSAEHCGSQPDLYGLLGVDRAASREEITWAWRQRARAEHPDSRPRDAAAPARFRVIAEAYRVLGDPARRAAYDRATAYKPRPRAAAPDGPTRVPAARRIGPGAPVAVTPLVWAPEAPLRAGPVRVENPYQVPASGPLAEEARLAVFTELALRYLTRGWGRPW